MLSGKKLTLALLTVLAGTGILSARSTPNIVVILADDFGYGSVNCYGAPVSMIRTPNMNQLAREGMRFTDANTPCSVCTPTRYALLTGRYAWRGRLKYGVLNQSDGGMLIEKDIMTLPAYLQQKGYTTAHIGKWHLGYTYQDNLTDYSAQPLEPGPRSIGFDYHFGVPNNLGHAIKIYVENESIWGLRSKNVSPYGKSYYGGGPYHGYDAPQRVTKEVTADLNRRAREWIFETVREEPDKPFFLYFAPAAIHNPVSPSKEFRGTSGCGAYGDFIQDLDHSVGEILDALAYSGVLDDTIVIFTSDNGGSIGYREERQARAMGFINNGIFREDKRTIWEGGLRVPFMVRWPGHIKAGSVSDRMINVVDIFATLQDLVGGEVLPPEDAGADSFSFFNELTGTGKDDHIRPHMVVNNMEGVMAIRMGPWKYIEGISAKPLEGKIGKSVQRQLGPQLYNLEEDIEETENLIHDYPEIHEYLQDALDQIRLAGSERLSVYPVPE